MPKLTIDDLNKLYKDAESVDQDIFSEQRSNVLLIAGEHYTKKGSKFWNRIRDSKELSNEQKLRLTKNHTQKIIKTYVNNILSHAPGVTPMPANDSELADQKAAELHKSVWEYAKDRYKMKKIVRECLEDFCGIGEVARKIFFDPEIGDLKHFEQAIGDDGQPMLDENGQPKEGKPVFTGDFVFERVFGFNLMRSPEARSMDESPYLIIRKMMDKDALKKRFPEGDERQKFVEDGAEESFMVFDGATGSYTKSEKDQIMLRECYYRPCHDYPMGYYYIYTVGGILWEGELPFGVFPIIYKGFDEIQTTPRGRSPVKVIRPYQAEINRSAGKIAEHQVTLGDDKLLVQAGTKITNAGVLPGVRGVSYTGMTPTILAGRGGEQYLEYMMSQIKEMYEVANVYEDMQEINGQLDPYVLLFRSIRNKKKFATYAEKFEEFLVEMCWVYLKLSKQYLSDDMLIPMIGRREAVNIAEYKNAQMLGFQIKLEPQVEDIETKMGKQLVMNHALQYVGNKLEKEDIGKLMRAMPFANLDESFDDLTIDYDAATNVILALDRGETPGINRYDTHPYMIRRLVSRMRQADFPMLPPQIQQNYQQAVAAHEEIQAQIAAEIERAQAGFIPTGGYLVACDFYVGDPMNPEKTKRARIPYQALEWLVKKIEQQGQSLEALGSLQDGAMAEIAQQMNQGKQSVPEIKDPILAQIARSQDRLQGGTNVIGSSKPVNAGPAVNTGQYAGNVVKL